MAKSRDTTFDDRMKRKKLEGVRVFVRDLFINGFRNRDGLNELADNKARAADESRQIIASILREYYRFEKKDGDRYFLAIDTRDNRHNPLHNIWKSKSFSAADIMMHFYILDYLLTCEKRGTVAFRSGIYDYVLHSAAYDKSGNEREYVDDNDNRIIAADTMKESKIREKLLEMEELGIIETSGSGMTQQYSLATSFNIDGFMEYIFADYICCSKEIGGY